MAVLWELWDSERAAVVYRVLTRATEVDIRRAERTSRLKAMVERTLRSLLSRPRFAAALERRPEDTEAGREGKAPYGRASFLECRAGALEMPKDAKRALAATALVRSGRGIGSGVSISPDGFVLTAAHVVRGETVTVVFRDGKEHEARLIRKNRKRDIALLKMKGSQFPCLDYRQEPAEVGEKIYVVGSPAAEKLAFTVTTGIVSAERNWDDDLYLQTDASVSPGNSGGPILDERGRVLATVSWKLVGIGVEGVGFGIPIGVALKALSIEPGDASDDVLAQKDAPVRSATAAPVVAFEDEPDEAQPLPERFSLEPEKTDAWKRPARHATRWLGVGLVAAGVGMAATSYLRVKTASNEIAIDPMTYRQYRAWIGVNIAGWAAASVGGVLFITSFFFRQSQHPEPETARAVIRGGFLGNTAALEVRF